MGPVLRTIRVTENNFGTRISLIRRVALVTVFAVFLLGHGGCGPVRVVPKDIEPTDLSSIFRGADRTTVEKVLGSPITVNRYDSQEIRTYFLDLGERGGPTWYYPNFIWADLVVLWIYVREEHRERYEGQRGKITILYDKKERIAWYEMGALTQQAMIRRAAIVTKAERGDGEAQLEVGLRSRPGPEQLQWFCKSANQDNKDAMNFLGTIYYFGLSPYKRNWIESYMWFSVAGFRGKEPSREEVGYYAWAIGFPSTVPPGKYVRDHLPDYPFTTDVFEGMKASDFVKAEKLAHDWKPNPANCAHGAIGSQ